MPPATGNTPYILEPKKRPKQARSQVTFDSIVQACEELLPESGYLGLTTTQIAERAGVNIASLYEYFYTKDAIVAEVANRAMLRSIDAFRTHLDEAMAFPLTEMLHFWIRLIYLQTKREEKLATALLFTVPFIMSLPSVHGAQALVSELVTEAYRLRPDQERSLTPESLYLMQTMTAGTVLALVLGPSTDIDHEAVLAELAERIYRF
ncbi:MAG: TetR/AcrR family transcriptional regulator [Polyangiaceae bacterium]|nr:TetR/AcrR family transcriptional regulator [Polyangiaceae bacterium]